MEGWGACTTRTVFRYSSKLKQCNLLLLSALYIVYSHRDRHTTAAVLQSSRELRPIARIVQLFLPRTKEIRTVAAENRAHDWDDLELVQPWNRFSLDRRVSHPFGNTMTPYFWSSQSSRAWSVFADVSIFRIRVVCVEKSQVTWIPDISIPKEIYTNVRKICTADDADYRCGHSLKHDETIDTLTIA